MHANISRGSGSSLLLILPILPIDVPSRATLPVAFALRVPDYWLEGGLDTIEYRLQYPAVIMPIFPHKDDKGATRFKYCSFSLTESSGADGNSTTF